MTLLHSAAGGWESALQIPVRMDRRLRRRVSCARAAVRTPRIPPLPLLVLCVLGSRRLRRLGCLRGAGRTVEQEVAMLFGQLGKGQVRVDAVSLRDRRDGVLHQLAI